MKRAYTPPKMEYIHMELEETLSSSSRVYIQSEIEIEWTENVENKSNEWYDEDIGF